jgi:septum formation protein
MGGGGLATKERKEHKGGRRKSEDSPIHFLRSLCSFVAKFRPVLKEKIILASASPRRRELLAEMGVQFEVVTADVRELDSISSPQLTPADLAWENARLKANAVRAVRPGFWVLGADTVVALGDRIFGKPASTDQAKEFLRFLSGRTHEVITGCALVNPDGEEVLFRVGSNVTFRSFTDATIELYLREVHVLDKAGAYALQEHGEWIIERVEGSRTNVIGLPTEKLESVLKSRGLL